MFFDIVRNDKQLHIIQMYDFSRLHTQWRNWRGRIAGNAPPGKLNVKTGRPMSLHFIVSILLVFSRLFFFAFFGAFSGYLGF